MNNFFSSIRRAVEKLLNRSPLWWRILMGPLCLLNHLIFYLSCLWKQIFFRQMSLPGTVIAIGGLRMGGSGKTPFLIFFLEEVLRDHPDLTVIILSRGYGSGLRAGDTCLMHGKEVLRAPELSSVHKGGLFYFDEAHLVLNRLDPHRVYMGLGADRNAVARSMMSLLEIRPEIDQSDSKHRRTLWVLEDGLNQNRFEIDFKFCVVDEDPAYSFSKVIPAGSYRRSWNQIQIDGWIVYDGNVGDAVEGLARGLGSPKVEVARLQRTASRFLKLSHGELMAVGTPSLEERWGLCVAIAHPHRVTQSLKELGCTTVASLFLGDHEVFTREVLQAFMHDHGLTALVITEKDYYRHPHVFAALPIYVIALDVQGSGDGWSHILGLFYKKFGLLRK